MGKHGEGSAGRPPGTCGALGGNIYSLYSLELSYFHGFVVT